MWVVGAEIPSLDPGGEMNTKRGDDLANPVNRVLDSLRHRGSRAFRIRTNPAILSTKADGGGELLDERVYLIAEAFGPAEVLEALSLFQVFPEFIEAALVFGLRSGVEDWTNIRGKLSLSDTSGLLPFS